MKAEVDGMFAKHQGTALRTLCVRTSLKHTENVICIAMDVSRARLSSSVQTAWWVRDPNKLYTLGWLVVEPGLNPCVFCPSTV